MKISIIAVVLIIQVIAVKGDSSICCADQCGNESQVCNGTCTDQKVDCHCAGQCTGIVVKSGSTSCKGYACKKETNWNNNNNCCLNYCYYGQVCNATCSPGKQIICKCTLQCISDPDDAPGKVNCTAFQCPLNRTKMNYWTTKDPFQPTGGQSQSNSNSVSYAGDIIEILLGICIIPLIACICQRIFKDHRHEQECLMECQPNQVEISQTSVNLVNDQY